MWCSAELDGLSLQCPLGLPPTLTKVLRGWGLPASCSEQLFALENLSVRRGLSSHFPAAPRPGPPDRSLHTTGARQVCLAL